MIIGKVPLPQPLQFVTVGAFEVRTSSMLNTTKNRRYKVEATERLTEIKDEIKDLINEAFDLVRQNAAHKVTLQRAESYWIPHVKMALDKEHDYMGGSMVTLQDTIDEIEKEWEGATI